MQNEAPVDLANLCEKTATIKGVANNCHESDEAFDDVTGAYLDPKLVREARAAEIQYFRKLGVYKKVPISKCFETTGQAPISVRWIDVNKQDDISPKYRSRLVARQFNQNADLEMFAATPWLEALRTIVSLAATDDGSKEVKKIMVNDVSRAYIYAPCLVPTFVNLCPEDMQPGEESLCGELEMSMYGTRPAAGNWHAHYSGILEKNLV